MSDLSYTVEVRGVQDLEKLSNTIDKLQGVLNAGSGAGKGLEEIRRIIVGMKGSGSVFTELRDAVRELNGAGKELRTGFQSSIKELQVVLKQGMAESAAMMRTAGVEQGQQLAKGITESTDEAVKAVRTRGRTIAAAARAEATRGYEAMVGGQPNAKVNDKGMAALFQYKEAGAQLSAYHREALANWVANGKLTMAARVKSESDTQTALNAVRKANDKALQSDVGGFQEMNRLRLAAAKRAADQEVLIDAAKNRQLLSNFSELFSGTKGQAAKSAKESAAVFSEVFAREAASGRQIFAGFNQSMRLDKSYIAKSAKDSAAAFNEAFALEAAKGKEIFARFNQSMGLDKSYIAKSAKDSAAVFNQAFAQELGKGRQLFANFEQSLGINRGALVKSAKDSAAVFNEAFALEAARGRQIFAGFNKDMGLDKSYVAKSARESADVFAEAFGGRIKNAKVDTGEFVKTAELKKGGAAMRALGEDMNYTHSMARGLASGFGALWLTWGQLAPLFIGAAISNGFMQTAKMGMEVAHTFAVIETVGGNTREEVQKLIVSMEELAIKGPHGPKEIAEAMKTLSLAGLNANKILAVTGTVLNFSVAGTTTIQKAAETLVQVSTAYGLGSEGFGYAADIISKAAAESMTSVEAFSNAMKSSSVIGEQYGVSLKDAALGIASLANLGIQGTAAGTAVRNLMSDLSGSTIKVAKLMEKLKIDVKDAQGNILPVLDMVGRLDDKLRSMDQKSAKNLLGALFSERSGKPIVEFLRQVRTEADDTSKGFANSLEEMRAKLDDAAGFTAIAAAKLSQSAQKQFETVGSTLQASMFKAFQGIEPQLVLIFGQMQKIFASPEFVSGLGNMTLAIATLAKVMTEYSGVLTALGLGYLALKTAQAAALGGQALLASGSKLIATLKASETVAIAANTSALAANNVAATTAGTAGGKLGAALGVVGRTIPLLNLVLGVGTGLWMAYEAWTSKSADSAKAAADNYHTNVVGALDSEASKLRRINDLRATGISLIEAEKRVNSEDQSKAATRGAASELDKAREEYDAAVKAQNKFAEKFKNVDVNRSAFARSGQMGKQLEELESNSTKALKNVQDAFAKTERQKAEYSKSEDELIRQSRRRANWEEDILKERKEKQDKLFGTGSFSLADGGAGAGGKAKFEKVWLDRSNELKMLEKGNTDELAMQKKLSDDKQKILMAEHQAGLLSEGQYQADLYALSIKGADAQIEAILKGTAAYAEAAKAREAYLKGEQAKHPGNNMIKSALADLTRESNVYFESAYRSIVEIQSTQATALEVASIKALGSIKKMNDAIREFWRKDAGEQSKARAIFEISKQYQFLNDSVFSFDVAQRAAAEAGTAAMEKYNTEMEKYRYQLDEVSESLETLRKSGFGPGDKLFDNLTAQRNAIDKALKDMQTRAVEGAAEAANLAFSKARFEQVGAFTKDIAGSITTALFEGGKAGRKRLRDLLVKELQKPITMVVNVLTNLLLNGANGQGGLLGAAMGVLGGGNAQGGGQNVMGALSNLNTANGLYTALTGFSGSVNTLAGFLGAGQTAGASAASLGYANAVGAMGGDALGAFQAANASWGGVGVGSGATTGAAGGASSTAGAAGSAAGILAGAAGGIFGGRAISGGYAVGGGSGNTAVNVGTAAGAAIGSIFPVIGTAIGALVGGLLGGVVNRVFGRKLKEVGIEGTFGGESGFQGQNYKFEKGGWFSSNKTTRTPLDEGVRQELAGQFNFLKLGAKTLAQDLGLGTDAIDKFSYSLKVNLKGLSDEEASTKITEEFDKMANTMADAVLGTTQYSRANETSLQTLTRLSGTLKYTNTVMKNLGGSMYTVSLAGANSAQNLIDLFGGLDKFNSALDSYYSNFYSEQERTKNATRELTESLKTLGFTMPTSRQGFRDIVDGVLKLGEKGSETFAILMGMQQAVADIFPDLVEDTKNLFDTHLEGLDKLKTNVEKLFNTKIAAGTLVDRIDEAMGKPGGEYAFKREQELWGLINKASYSQQIDMASELTDLLLARMDLEKEAIGAGNTFWSDTNEYIKSLATGSLSPLNNQEKLAAAQQEFNATLTKAKSGDTTAQGQLQGTADTYLELARTFFASSQQYTDIFKSVTNGMLNAASGTPVGSSSDPAVVQAESYAQLNMLREIAAKAYEATSADLLTSQNLLATQASLLAIEAEQLGRTSEVRDILATLPAEIALAMPAFDASVFQALGYNQARTVETLQNIEARLLAAQEAGTADAHMQAAVYVEAMEKTITFLADAVSRGMQGAILTDRAIIV